MKLSNALLRATTVLAASASVAAIVIALSVVTVWSSSGPAAARGKGSDGHDAVTSGMVWAAAPRDRGKDLWQSCREHFGYDVIRVRQGPPGVVYCFVPTSHNYGQGQPHRNFNR